MDLVEIIQGQYFLNIYTDTRNWKQLGGEETVSQVHTVDVGDYLHSELRIIVK